MSSPRKTIDMNLRADHRVAKYIYETHGLKHLRWWQSLPFVHIGPDLDIPQIRTDHVKDPPAGAFNHTPWHTFILYVDAATSDGAVSPHGDIVILVRPLTEPVVAIRAYQSNIEGYSQIVRSMHPRVYKAYFDKTDHRIYAGNSLLKGKDAPLDDPKYDPEQYHDHPNKDEIVKSILEAKNAHDKVRNSIDTLAVAIDEASVTYAKGAAWIVHYLSSCPEHLVGVTPEEPKAPRKPPKKRQKKPWLREGLPQIILLDPKKAREYGHRIDRGGSHASPVPHQRRGHWRMLRAERWGTKRHTRVWVRPAWIGDKEWIHHGNRYEVIETATPVQHL